MYYTQLHPGKENWESLTGAHILSWDADYSQVTAGLQDTTYFIYTGGFPDAERNHRTAQIEKNMREVSYAARYICYVYGYVPKGK